MWILPVIVNKDGKLEGMGKNRGPVLYQKTKSKVQQMRSDFSLYRLRQYKQESRKLAETTSEFMAHLDDYHQLVRKNIEVVNDPRIIGNVEMINAGPELEIRTMSVKAEATELLLKNAETSEKASKYQDSVSNESRVVFIAGIAVMALGALISLAEESIAIPLGVGLGALGALATFGAIIFQDRVDKFAGLWRDDFETAKTVAECEPEYLPKQVRRILRNNRREFMESLSRKDREH